MKKSIERTLFYFKDGELVLNELNDRFFPYDNLLNRLLSEKYNGKKIKFINILFSTEETYRLFPKSQKFHVHFYGGYLTYNALFDFESFRKKNERDQIIYIWNEAYESLKNCALSLKNDPLLEACEFAYKQGLDSKLNPNFKLLEIESKLYGDNVQMCLWIIFTRNEMMSKLTIEKESKIIFERDIDKTKLGVEFFLDMYKKIEHEDGRIVIKGHKEAEGLPYKILVSKNDLRLE